MPTTCTGTFGHTFLLMLENCSNKDKFINGIFAVFLTAVERIILEQIGELHIKLDHLTLIVQSLRQNRAQEQQPQSNEFDHIFPISTLQELNCLDERLLRDGDFKKHVVCSLML